MKKQITSCVAVAALLSASAVFAGGPEIIPEPDYFTGLFVGGTGAFHHVSLDATSSIVAPDNISVPLVVAGTTQILIPAGTSVSSNGSGSDFSGYGGVQGGIGKVFNHQWYLGLVGFGEWGNASNTATNTVVNPPITQTQTFPLMGSVVTATVTSASSSSSQTTLKIENDYGVAAKFGYLVTSRTLFYGKVGVVWADLEASNSATLSSTVSKNLTRTIDGIVVTNVTSNESATLSGSSSNEENKTALLLAIGAEQFIYKDMLSVNVEYDYANFGSVSTSANMTANLFSSITNNITGVTTVITNQQGVPTTAVAQASGNAKVSTLLAGLNFYFGHNWF